MFEPQILMQVITVRWSKASRGGQAAGVRNRVPAALPIPAAIDQAAGLRLMLHEAWYGEENGFTLPHTTTVRHLLLHGTFRHAGAALTCTADVLRIDLHWTHEAPRRRPLRGALTLRAGEWGQICFNGRSGHGLSWRYSRHTINVGLFSVASPTVFVTTVPTRRYEHLANLW